MYANFLCEGYLLWWSKIRVENTVFHVKYFNLSKCFPKVGIFNHEKCENWPYTKASCTRLPSGIIKCILCMCAIHMYSTLAQVLGN